MIKRLHIGERMSQAAIHGDTVYLAGQVGAIEKVEALLAEAGSKPENMLQVIIWLDDMADFAEMNAVWDAWVPQGHTPARACGEAKLATPDYKVEIIVTAAIG